MTKTEKVLAYLADVASLGGGRLAPFASSAQCWRLGFDELSSGALSLSLTQRILEQYSHLHAEVGFGEQEVPVIACLARLVDDSKKNDQGEPLLYLPGYLQADGKLRPRDGEPAWISLRRLERDGSFDEPLTVCDIDAYRAHQMAMATLPDDGSWQTAAVRAMDLFRAVASVSEEIMKRDSFHIESNESLLTICETHDPIAASGIILNNLRNRFGEQEVDRLGALTDILCLDGDEGIGELGNDDGNQKSDNASLTHNMGEESPVTGRLFVTGMPGDMGSLSPEERETVIEFARQTSGGSLALHTPKGTNSLRMALAIMGQAITDSVLRGDAAPAIVCTAPHDELQAIARLIDERPLAGQTSLSSRWLPRISYGKHAHGNGGSASRRTLGPIVSIIMHHVAGDAGTYDGGRVLTEPIGHCNEGASATFSDSWYVPKATMYFLDCCSSFLGMRLRDVADATSRLSERLRIIDQDRNELLSAYEKVCHATKYIIQREVTVTELGRLRREHNAVRKRLSAWERLAKRYPIRKGIMARRGPSQREVIARHILEGETLAIGCESVEDIRKAYQREIDRIESDIDRLRGVSAHLSRRVHDASDDGKQCLEAIERLVTSCGLAVEQATLLESVIDGREGTLRGLDEILDVTIRPAEFWLSVHVLEGRWLMACADQSAQRDLRALFNLCPIHLVENTILPSFLLANQSSDGNTTPLDLIVAIDAQHVDVPTGVAMLSQTKQAVVMGSVGAPCTPSLFGGISDELFATRTISGELWREIAQRKLICSCGASLFSTMLSSKRVGIHRLGTIEDSYGELADVRSDLVPSEQVHTMRIPSNFADDRSYPLARIVPAVSYVLVPDSAWGTVGSSRQNVAEAYAIVRWLRARHARIANRYGNPPIPPILVMSAYKSQAAFIKKIVAEQEEDLLGAVTVKSLDDVGYGTWPLVLLSATCGPENYGGLPGSSASTVLCEAAAAATDALVVFCGGAWVESAHESAGILMKRARLMGKLFSVARKGRLQQPDETNTQVEVEETRSELNPRAEDNLRVRPQSLTRLLRTIEMQGEYDKMPTVHEVNVALSRVGLIKRYADGAGHSGWRPTASGREIGIVPTLDRAGNPFCSYGPASEPVLVNIVESLIATDAHASIGNVRDNNA